MTTAPNTAEEDREAPAADPSARRGAVVFESYGRADARPLADRLRLDLEQRGFDVWQDIERLQSGNPWEHQVRDALHNAHVVVALLSPQAVRVVRDSATGQVDSVCLDELSYARFAARKPIVPVMALPCEPPFVIFRLDYVDLCGWEQSETAYESGLERIVDAISAAVGGEVRYRRWDRELAPWDFGPYLNEKRKGFAGREWLYDELDTWRRTSNDPALLLVGDPGAGKTALVAELVLRNPDGQVLAYHCCQADTPATLQPGRFVRSLAAMLAARLPAYAAAIEQPVAAVALEPAASDADPRTAFEAGIVAPLWAIPAPEGGPRYILIDALDESLAQGSGAGIVEILASRIGRLPPWLRIVATTRRLPAVIDQFGAVVVKSLDAADARNRDDVGAYIATRLASEPLRTVVSDAAARPEAFAQAIANASAGNFLYARQTLDAIERGTLKPTLAAQLPPGVGSLYHNTLAAQFPGGAGFDAARAVLGILDASPEPLTFAQLTSIAGLAPATVRETVTRLAGYIAIEGDVLTIFHRSFADWLASDAAGEFRVDLPAAKTAILAYCRNWSASNDGYAFLHLPATLVAAGQVEELASLLEHTDFLLRKTTRTGNPFLEADDFATLAAEFIRLGRADAIVALARSEDQSRRDGVIVALSKAAPESRATVDLAVRGLLATGRRRFRDPELIAVPEMNARVAGLRAAGILRRTDLLLIAALDPVPSIRAMTTPLLLGVFDRDEAAGWGALTQLRLACKGRIGTVKPAPMEALTGLSVALLAQRFEAEDTLPRLREEWRLLARTALRGSFARRLGGRFTGIALARVIEAMLVRQPAWQQFNMQELRAVARIPVADRAPTIAVLADLRDPERGFASALALLESPERPFDLFTMLVLERTLVFHGTRNPTAVLDAVSAAYTAGPEWFRQSAPYIFYQVLRANPAIAAAWQQRYDAIVLDWIERTRAVLTTPSGHYEALPNIAAAEDMAQRVSPASEPRIIPPLLATALARGDTELATRLIRGASQLSFGYHHHLAALQALLPAFAYENSDVRPTLVAALADVRLLAEGLTDRFVTEHGSSQLGDEVRRTPPTIRAADFGGWVDDFVNACVRRSDTFRSAVADAFAIAGQATSVSEGVVNLARWAGTVLASDD